MSNVIKVEKLEKEFNKLLKEYGDEVTQVIDEEVQSVAKDTAALLKKTSPKNTGKYSKSWKVENRKLKKGASSTIYNGQHAYLTHILEFGHILKDGGRTKAQPHIEPAKEWAGKELEDRVIKRLKG